MSAGLPLLIFSILGTTILVVWVRNGSGDKAHRIRFTCVVIFLLVSSWLALLSFGVFHPVGLCAMAVGFVVSIAAFFIPMVYNKLVSNERK